MCSLLITEQAQGIRGKPSMLTTLPSELGCCNIPVLNLASKQMWKKQVSLLACKPCSLDPDAASHAEKFMLYLPTGGISFPPWTETVTLPHSVLYACKLRTIFIFILIETLFKACLGSWVGVSVQSMLITQFWHWSHVWLPHDSNHKSQITSDRNIQPSSALREVRELSAPSHFHGMFCGCCYLCDVENWYFKHRKE